MAAFRFCPSCAAPLMDGHIDQEPRRLCSARCGFVHYDNPTPVVAAVVEYQGCVVLAHNRSWPPHMRSFYGLITGFLERDESPEQCVMREVKEELALEATSATLIGVYSFTRMNQVIIAFHVPATGSIVLNHELDEHKLVQPHECRAWSSGTGLALRDWLRTRGIEAPMMDLNAQQRPPADPAS